MNLTTSSTEVFVSGEEYFLRSAQRKENN